MKNQRAILTIKNKAMKTASNTVMPHKEMWMHFSKIILSKKARKVQKMNIRRLKINCEKKEKN